jgi:hypothetical protein
MGEKGRNGELVWLQLGVYGAKPVSDDEIADTEDQLTTARQDDEIW